MKEYLYYIFEPKNDTAITEALTPIKTELADTNSSAIKVDNIVTLMDLLGRSKTPNCILFDQNGLNQIREANYEIELLRQSDLTLILLNSKDPNYISVTPANWNVITLLAQGTVSKIYCDMSQIRISFPNKNASILVNNKHINKTNNFNTPKNKSNRKNRKEKQAKPEIQIELPKENEVPKAKNVTISDNSSAKNMQANSNEQPVQKSDVVNKQKEVAKNNNITKKSSSNHEKVKEPDTEPSQSVATTDNKPLDTSTLSKEPFNQEIQKGFADFNNGNTYTPDEVSKATNANVTPKPQTITFGNHNILKQEEKVTNTVSNQTEKLQDYKQQSITKPDTSQTTENNKSPENDQDFLAQAIHAKPKPKSQPKPDNQESGNQGSSVETLHDAINDMDF